MPFLANFTKLCNSIGKSPTAVCKELGLSNATYTYWRKNASVPSDKTLTKIATYFGVQKDDLLSEDVSFKENFTGSVRGRVRVALKEPSEHEILKLYRGSSPEARAFARQILEKSVEAETPVSAEVVDRPVSPIVAVKRGSIRGEVSSKRGGGVKVKLREGKKGGKGWK